MKKCGIHMVEINSAGCFMCNNPQNIFPQERKPHKCPICDGTGTQAKVSPRAFGTAVKCHACDGTCIVWEPK